MGFPVSDQVDLMLPLLGLQPVLGASVVANTTAAENDDDGPHQPKPCRGGERDVSQGARATSNPEKPINMTGRSLGSVDLNPVPPYRQKYTDWEVLHVPTCIRDCCSGSLR